MRQKLRWIASSLALISCFAAYGCGSDGDSDGSGGGNSAGTSSAGSSQGGSSQGGEGGSGQAGQGGSAPGGSSQGGSAQGGSQSFSALDHVSGSTYTGLLIEVDSVAGVDAGSAALQRLQQRLEDLIASGHLGKPDGVRLVLDEDDVPGMGSDHAYTLEELQALSASHRNLTPNANESAMYILYVEGGWEGDEGGNTVTLGFADKAGNISMFANNIQSSCDQGLQLPPLSTIADQVCAVSEATVLVHEVGHIFGLVNNGLPMVEDHQDTEHGRHSNNSDSVMYWLLESGSTIDVIAERFLSGEEAVPEFDAACKADLAAAQ